MKKVLLRTICSISFLAVLLSTASINANPVFAGINDAPLHVKNVSDATRYVPVRKEIAAATVAAGSKAVVSSAVKATKAVVVNASDRPLGNVADVAAGAPIPFAPFFGCPINSYQKTGPGVYQFTVPVGVTELTITGVGAAGGNDLANDPNTVGGRGASLKGKFSVTPGEILYLLVGGKGGDNEDFLGAGGGGGGTFVTRSATFASNLLMAAGGGGGAGENDTNLKDANVDPDGNDGLNAPFANGSPWVNGGDGGFNGSGGSGGEAGGSGAGWLLDGENDILSSFYLYLSVYNTAGISPRNSYTSISNVPTYSYGGVGGFGGGGSAALGGGGGGGYSGGGGGAYRGDITSETDPGRGYSGGGGGSFNGGNPGTTVNTPGVGTGDGSVTIEWTTPTPVISITGGSNPFCQGGSATLTASSLGTGSTYLWSNGATSQSIVVTAAGSYSVTVSAPDICAATSAPTVITVNNLPSIAVTPSSASINTGGNVVLTASGGSTYTWSPATGLSGTTGAVVTASPTATTTYTVTGVDGNSCSKSTTVTVTVSAVVNPLVPGAILNNQIICNGTVPAAFTSTTAASGGTGAISYQWQFSTDNTNFTDIVGATSDTYTAGAISQTTYFRRGAKTAVDAFQYTSSVKVTVNALPTVTANNAGGGCVGDKIELFSSPGSSYSWTGPNGFTSNQQNPVINSSILANAGTYTVTVTNAAGCSASASTTVAVNVLPVISAGSNSPVCEGSTLNLTSNGGVSYIWNGPNGFTFTGQNPVLNNVTTAASGTYFVKGTGANGCRNDASVNVTVTPKTTPTFTQVAAICAGASLAALPTTSTNGIPGTWSPALNNTATTTYTFTPDAGQCATNATMTIAVNTSSLVLSGTTTVCQNGSFPVLTATLTQNGVPVNGQTVTFVITAPGGSTTNNSVTTNAAGVASFSVQTLVNGVFTCQAVFAGSSSYCAASSGNASVTVTPQNTVTLGSAIGTNAQTVCTNTAIANITYNTTGATNANFSGLPAGVTGNWSNNVATISGTPGAAGTYNYTVTLTGGCGSVSANGTITVNTPVTPTFTQVAAICTGASLSALPTTSTNNITGTWSPALNNTATTTYTFTPDAGQCATTATMTITVNALPNATASNNGPACVGGSLSLTASGGVSYLWSGPSGFNNTSPNTGFGGITLANAGTYSVEVTDANGCKNTATTTVVVNTLAPINGPDDICVGSTTTLTASGTPAASNPWWSTNQSVATVNSAGVVTGLAPGGTLIIYTNSSGCAVNKPFNVYSVPTANVTASGPTTFCSGGSVVLTASGGSNYLWSNGETTASITVNASGNYSVTVFANINGCSATSAVTTVTVNPSVTVGNNTGNNTLCQGATSQLSNATSGGVWSSNNTNVATVSASGLVTAVAPGTATITYAVTNNSCGTTSATTTVTVNAVPTVTLAIPASQSSIDQSHTGTSQEYVCLSYSQQLAQSFTAGRSGNLSKVSIDYQHSGNCVTSYVFTVDILAGNGWNGAVLATTRVTVPLPWNRSMLDIVFASPAFVTAGQMYTIRIIPDANQGSCFECGAWFQAWGDYDHYTGGGSFLNGSPYDGTIRDKYFQTYIALPGSLMCTSSTPLTLSGGLPAGGVYSGVGVSGGVFNPAVSGPGVFPITYTYTSGGCSNSAVDYVTVNAVPTLAAITGADNICLNSTSQLSNAITGGTWSSSNTSIASVNANTGVVTGVSVGSANIIYTVNTPGCGSTSVNKSVTIVALPTVPAITGGNKACPSSTLQLANATSGGVWSSSNTSVATVSSTGLVTTLTAGTTTITYTVTSNVCSGGASASMPLVIAPITTTFTTKPSCIGSSTGTATVSAVGGGGSNKFFGTTGRQNNAELVSIDIATGVATLIGSTNLGGGVPGVAVNAAGEIYAIGTNYYNVLFKLDPTTGVATQVGSPSNNVCSNSPAMAFNNAGVLYAADRCGWIYTINTTTGQFTQVATPGQQAFNGIQFDPTTGILYASTQSQLFTLDPNNNYYATYVGNFNGYGRISDILFDASGQLYAVNGGGGSGNEFLRIDKTNASPTFVGYTGISNIAGLAGGGTSYTYLWDNGQTTQTATGLSTGTHTVTVTDANGCSATSTVTITEDPKPTKFTVTGGGSYCQYSNGVQVGLSGSESGVNYQLYHNNSPINNPVAGNGNAINFGTFYDAGTYTVVASKTQIVCTEPMQGEAVIVVNPLPDANITYTGANSICNNATLLLSASTGANYSYQWKKDGNNIPDATGATYAAGTTGYYSVVVTETVNGCSQESNSVFLEVFPTPVITVSGSTTFCGGDTRVLTSSTGSGSIYYTGYTWNPGNQTGNAVTVGASGSYTVTATNGTCSATSEPVVLTATENTLNLVAAIVSPATCANTCDASISLTPSGGVGGYTYGSSYDFSGNNLDNTLFTTSGGAYYQSGGTLYSGNANNYSWSTIATARSFATSGNFSYEATFKSYQQEMYFGLTDGTAALTNNTSDIKIGFYRYYDNLQIFEGGNWYSSAYLPNAYNDSYDFKIEKTGNTINYYYRVTGSGTYTLLYTSNTTIPATVKAAAIHNNYYYYQGYTSDNWIIKADAKTTGLCPGTYTYTIYDASGCFATTTVVVPVSTAPGGLQLTATPTAASCDNGCSGSISLVPSGGTGPYSYGSNYNFSNGTLSDLFNFGNYNSFTQSNGELLSGSGAFYYAQFQNNISSKRTFDIGADLSFEGSFKYTGGYYGNLSAFGFTRYFGTSLNDWSQVVLGFAIDGGSLYGVYNEGNQREYIGSVNSDTYYDYKVEKVGSTINYYMRETGSGSYNLVHTRSANYAGNVAATAMSYNYYNGYYGSLSSKNWVIGAAPRTTNLCPGTYTYTVYDATGCAAEATVTVVADPGVFTVQAQTTNVSATGACDGAVTFTGTGSNTLTPVSKVFDYPFSGTSLNTSLFEITNGDFSVNGDLRANQTGQNDYNNSIITQQSFTDGGKLSFEASFKADYNYTTYGYFGFAPTSGYTGSWDTYPIAIFINGDRMYATFSGNGSWTDLGQYPAGNWYDFKIEKIGTAVNFYSRNSSPSDPWVLKYAGTYNGAQTSFRVGANYYTYPYYYYGGFNSRNWKVIAAAPTTGLCEGTYTYTVISDGGCSKDVTFTITDHSELSFTKQSVNPSCYGSSNGSITITATGGTAPYQYSIDGETFVSTNTFTGLAAGTYNITVKDAANVTAAMQTVVLTEPAQVIATVTAGGPTTFCAGGSVILTSSAATGNQWSTGATTQSITVNAAGTYSVTVNVNGCEATSAATTVVVNALPTAIISVTGSTTTCPGNTVTLHANTDGDYTYQWFKNGQPIAQANNADYAAGSTGNYTVVITNSSHCASAPSNAITVTVEDVTAPVVPVLADVTGQCDATAPVATTTDDCAGVINGTTSDPLYYNTPGTHIIHWSFNDGHGHVVTATQNVIIHDVTPPVVTCPSDIIANATTIGNAYGASVTFAATSATDNCGTPTVTYSPASGSFFPVGTTEVTVTADDGHGNTASCTFNVIVHAPEINITGNNVNIVKGDATPEAADHTHFGVTFPGTQITRTFTIQNTGSDNLNISSINIGGVDAANFTVSNFAPGVVEAGASVTFDVTFLSNAIGIKNAVVTVNNDDYDESSYDFAISAEINCLPPAFTVCATDINTNTDAGLCSAVVNYTTTVSGIPSPALSYTFTGATIGTGAGTGSGMAFNKGVTTVTITATNACGTTQCSFTVTVVDNENPVITGTPAPISKSNDAGVCGAVVNWTLPTATDNCPGVTLVSNHQPGEVFPVGTTTVTYTATDASGHTVTTSFTIVVTDDENPIIITPASITHAADAGKCSFTFTPMENNQQNPNGPSGNNGPAAVYLGTATATDNCGVVVIGVRNDGEALDAPYPVGQTIITWTATDLYGHVVSNTQTVTITDDESPVISNTPANISVSNNPGVCGAVVTWTLPTASDNCPGVTLVSDYASGYQFPIGTTTVTYTATDAHGHITTTQFNVTVVDDEKPAFVCPADITVLGTAGINGSNVSYAVTATDNCGTPAVSYSIAPNSFFPMGTTPVTVTVTDANGNIVTCTFNVTVMNNPPEASPDVVTTPEDTQVSGNVLTNDSDLDGNGITVTGFTINNVNHAAGSTVVLTEGTLVLNADGTFTFTPAPNFNGSVPVVTYSIIDNNGGTAVSTLTISVTPVDDAPIATNDVVSVDEDGSVTATVRNNDTESGDGGNTWSLVTGPTHGVLVFNADGSYTYTPNANFNGTDAFTYQVCDIDGDCSTATVTITVNSVDDAPVAVNDVNSVDEDGSVTATVRNNDTESGDGGNTWSLVTGPTHGVLVFNADGSYTYTPNANFNGTDAFTYQVCDIDGDCSTATVTITVNSVDDAPVAVNDVNSVDEDGSLTATVRNNDTESGDGGNTWSLVTGPTHGVLVFNTDGSYTYTPNANFNGTDAFTYQVCDIDGDCSTATVTITVNSVDDAPVAVNDVNSVDEDGSLTATVRNNDTESGDGGNTWSLVTGPTHGVLVFNADGSYTYTPNANFNGTDAFTYQVCDIDGDCSTATVTITVNSVDDAPVAVNDVNSVDEDGSLTATVRNNDTESGDGGNTWSLVTGPSHGVLVFNADGSYTYTPAANFHGTDSFTYQVCDADNDCSTATVTITVNSVDDLALVKTKDITVYVDATGHVSITAGQIDDGSYDADGIASITLDKTNFDCSNLGPNTVTLTVTDIYGNSASATATVTVLDVIAPSIICPAPVTVQCASAVPAVNTASVISSDNCSAVVTFAGDVISNQTAPNKYTITRTYRATDPSGNSTTCTQIITVNDDTKPVLVGVLPGTTNGQCLSDVPAAPSTSSIAALYTDNCSGALTAVLTNTTTSGNNASGWTRKYFYNVSDVSGNTTIACVTYSGKDNVAPTINCPSNISVVANIKQGVQAGANVSFTATASDNCGTPTLTYSPASGSFFPVGTTVVTVTANDGNGNIKTCTFNVTVSCTTPVFTQCPSDVTVNTAAGLCSAVVNYSAIASLGAPAAGLTYTFTGATTGSGTGTGSGSTFVKGVTTVTICATNVCGVSKCIFNVTVVDNENPVITGLPANITKSNDAGTCGAVVTWTAPSVSDNCPGAVISSNLSSGAVFPVGTTTVTYTATDAANRTVTGSFTVTVQDKQAPVINCPAAITIACGLTTNPAITGKATATDNCNGIVTITYSDVVSGNTTTRTWTATDVAGNSSTCKQIITIGGPFVTSVTSVPTNNTYTGGGPNTLFIGYGAQSSTLTTSVPSGSSYTYVWTGADVAMLSSTTAANPVFTPTRGGNFTFNVTVTNSLGCISTASVSVCVTDIRVFAGVSNGGSCNHQSHYSNNCPHQGHGHSCSHQSHGSYNCPDNDDHDDHQGMCNHQSHNSYDCPHKGHNHSCNHRSHSSYSCSHRGTNDRDDDDDDEKTCDHKSHSSSDCSHKGHNHSSCNHSSHSSSNCPHGRSYGSSNDTKVCNHQSHNSNDCNHNGHNHGNCNHQSHSSSSCTHNGGNGGTDDDDSDSKKVYICHVPPGNSGMRLTLSISVNAVAAHLANHPGDRLGSCDQAPCSGYTDNVKPVIDCSDNVTVAYGASTSPSATGSPEADDNSGDVTITYTDASNRSANAASAGYYNYTITRTWKATDLAGNYSTCVQTITVQDITKPVITCPAYITVACGSIAPAVTGMATATDNSGNVTITYTDATGSNYTTRTWKATDPSGNYETCTQKITVVDNVKPVLTVPNDITVECGSSTVPAVTGNATATDLCSSVTITYSDATSGNKITRTWKAKDAAGNYITDTQVITIVDNTKPIVSAPADITISCGASTSPKYTGGSATGSDNCSSVTVTYSDVVSGNTIIRTWKGTDESGNSATDVQVITMVDNTKPVISDVSDITISCSSSTTPSGCGSVATATDNCSTPVVSYSDVTNGNKITRTWKAVDAAGNTATSTQIITIVDNTKPVIADVADKTVNCGASTLPAATGTATATDNCSTAAVTYTDATSGNVITRTWKATDASGNYSTSVQTITVGVAFTATVSSVPTSSTYTGGVSTNLYLGYGAQSTTLTMCSLPSAGAPYTYSWSGSYTNKLNSTTVASPVFTPSTFGYYTFSVTVTNKYGCTSTGTISICVTDIRVPGTNGAKVYMCHKASGKYGTTQTLQVAINQVSSHLGSSSCGSDGNDRLGSCDQSSCNTTVVNSVVTNNSNATKEGGSEVVVTSEEELKVTAMPNPSTTFFTLKLESKYETPVTMRVMDGTGRVVDARSKIGANSTIQIGHNYSSGTYYAELIQGGTRKVVQLIKGRG